MVSFLANYFQISAKSPTAYTDFNRTLSTVMKTYVVAWHWQVHAAIADKSRYVELVICYYFGSALVWLESLTRKRSKLVLANAFACSSFPLLSAPTTFPDMPDGVLSRLHPFLKPGLVTFGLHALRLVRLST